MVSIYYILASKMLEPNQKVFYSIKIIGCVLNKCKRLHRVAIARGLQKKNQISAELIISFFFFYTALFLMN